MEESIHLQVLGGIALLAILLGITAARTNFCTMGAVSDWVNMEDTGRLRAWLLAAGVATSMVTLLEWRGMVDLASSFPPYSTPILAWPRYLLGGVLFGIGMTLGSGCGNKTLVRIGGGNLKSVVVLICASTMAYQMLWGTLYASAFEGWMTPLALDLGQFGLRSQGVDALIGAIVHVENPAILRGIVGLAIAALLIGYALTSREFRESPMQWGSGLVIGLLVAAAWWLTGGSLGGQWKEWAEMADTPPLRVASQSFTFVSAMGDGMRYALKPGDFSLVSVGLVAAVGVIVGSLLNALIAREWRLEWFAGRNDFISHLVGGTLMGIGGVLSMGCTFGQGITGISTLAVGAFLTLAAIIAGAAITMKIQYRLA